MPKQFGFCKICRLNHDQGKGHKYSIKHKKNLAQLLAKFHKKIQDVVFFIKNPMLLRPEDKDRNRFWCVACEEEIDERDSYFACCNAIKHLASSNHMEFLKSFWSENGAEIEKRNMYHISQQDFLKWENRCRTMKSGATSSGGSSEDLNNIHLKHSSVNKDTFGKVSMNTLANNLYDGVLPLQHFKDESIQVSYEADTGASVANVASQEAGLSRSVQKMNADQQPVGQLAQQNKCTRLLSYNGVIPSGDTTKDYLEQKLALSAASGSSEHGLLHVCRRHEEVYNSARTVEDDYQAHHLTRIFTPLRPGEPKANVHSGAPPPWLTIDEGTEATLRNETHGNIQRLSKTQERKLKRLRNPKRVGAAWAEQRRAELERELKGEASDSNITSDATWLPNFGRVWQSGSRRDSRKEFEAEKKRQDTFDSRTEQLVEVQPYVSKRKRMGAKAGSGEESEVHTNKFSNGITSFH